ncbi:MAG TPA: DUF1761 domain-containing protein [Sphingomonas sp.]
MIYIAINAVAIMTAALASLAFGIGYYRLADRSGAIRFGGGGGGAGGAISMLVIFVAEAWFAAILAGALILAPPEAGQWTKALGSAVIIWIGFVVPVLIVTHRIRERPNRAALIDCGHWLGAMIVQAVVLQMIGLQAPTG